MPTKATGFAASRAAITEGSSGVQCWISDRSADTRGAQCRSCRDRTVKAPGSAYTALDPGEAILKMGRPTLVVPEAVSTLRAEHVVIGWKDTREARRAVLDSLPFLQEATRVTIVEACEPDEEKTALGQLDDVSSLSDAAPDQRRSQSHA